MAKADGAARVGGLAEETGGGADLLLWWLSENRGMSLGTTIGRAPVRGRSRLRGHDSSDGVEAVGTWLRISKQVRNVNSANFASVDFSEGQSESAALGRPPGEALFAGRRFSGS